MPAIGEYAIFYCSVHKTEIHYLIRYGALANESQCWTCVRDANLSKSKKESKLRDAREQFLEEFSHLWIPNVLGGIVSAKIELGGINVSIETSAEVFNEIPNIYLGYTITKQIVGAVL